MAKLQRADLVAKPDFDFWLQREEWTVTDAAILLAGAEPRDRSGRRIKAAMSLPNIEEAVDPVQRARQAAGEMTDTRITDAEAPVFLRALEIESNAWAAIRRGNLEEQGCTVEPRDFIRWASRKGYEIPPALAVFVGATQIPKPIRAPESRWTTTAQLWTTMEAAYLLADIEPDPSADPSNPISEVAALYRDLKDAVTLGQIEPVGNRTSRIASALLKPADVVAWARDAGRSVPPRLNEIPPLQPTRAELVARIAELEARVEPAPTSDPPLAKRERDNLHRIIVALARHARVELDRPSKAAGVIEKLAAQVGVTIPLRTIEHHLRRAHESVEQQAKEST